MMVRAIICCAALVLGLLATLGATAQSAEKARPLDLMAFMRGDVKTSAKTATKTASAKTASTKTASTKTSKHRHGESRSAARPDNTPGVATDPVPLPQPAALPVAAAAAYASHGENDGQKDVQVVTSDQLNTIDLAMLGGSPETIGASQKADATDTDVSVLLASADVRPKPDAASHHAEAPRHDSRDDVRDDSWMGRIWSAVGDGFVALVAMLRQLFA